MNSSYFHIFGNTIYILGILLKVFYIYIMYT
jgi:hypothetical protein